MFRDIHYGWRQLLKTPVFTLTALVSLALGIGASVTMFSAFRAVFLRSLPYPDPGQIIEIEKVANPSDTVADREFLRRYARSLQSAASFGFFETATLSGITEPTDLWVRSVSQNLFDVLGAKALIGRTFLPSDFRAGASQTAVLAFNTWQKQFQGDPAVVGRTIFLSGQSRVVVGVMPKGVDYPKAGTAAWLPDRTLVSDPTKMYIAIVARLRPGVSLAQAQAELNDLTPALLRNYPPSQPKFRFKLKTVSGSDVDEYRGAFRLLLGATGFLLLLACFNVASLLLSRSSARSNEFAIRGALGGRRARLIAQVLNESLLLAALSGICGMALAYLSNRILIRLLPAYLAIPRLENTHLDLEVLGFALLLTFVVALFFGLAPALGLSGSKLAEIDRQGRSIGGRAWLHSAFLVAEIAIALILFAGSILMLRGFVRLANVNPGFRTAHILTATVPPGHAARLTRPALTQRYSEILRLARNVPGVQLAALTGYLPLGMVHVTLLVHLAGLGPEEYGIDYHAVSHDYFHVMGIPLLQGRVFSETNPNLDAGAVVINQAMAQKYWPGKNMVGQPMSRTPGEPGTIIGIVGNTQSRSLGVPIPEFYESYQQYLGPAVGTTLVLRTYGDPISVASTLRQAIHRFDPDQVVENERTLQTVVEESIATPRFYTILMGIFAVLALLLTLIGVYGVASYGASLRTREFGIRLALGAQRRQLIRMIIRQGLIGALVGVAAGAVGAWALARLMSGLVYGVPVKDPVSLSIAASLLIAGALIAYYLPARRSTGIDPATVLRQQ